MPDSNLHIYERLIEAFNESGPEGALRFYHEDAEVFDPDAPEGRSYRGRDAVARFLDELVGGSDVAEIRAWRLHPAGDRVVGLLHTRRSRESDGAVVEMIEAHTLTFREGKVSYWRVHIDPREALADAGLDPQLVDARDPAEPEPA